MISSGNYWKLPLRYLLCIHLTLHKMSWKETGLRFELQCLFLCILATCCIPEYFLDTTRTELTQVTTISEYRSIIYKSLLHPNSWFCCRHRPCCCFWTHLSMDIVTKIPCALEFWLTTCEMIYLYTNSTKVMLKDFPF